jgi:GTPase Era involved in 16S rRNA processing
VADFFRLKAVPAFQNEWEFEDPSLTCGSSSLERVEDAIREQLFKELDKEVPYVIVQRNKAWLELNDPLETLFVEQELLVRFV